MKVRVTNEMVAAASRLRAISCATTGSDHIERNTLTERHIPVFTLKEDSELLQNLTPAAELSWALLLACARRLPAAAEHVRKGGWVREDFPGTMLNGKTLGLIGCGRIGGWLARYGLAFGMTVIAYDRYTELLPEGVASRDLKELVQESDFLSMHVHLNDETNGLLSRELLSTIKHGAVVINTSRGALLDEAALLGALESGRVAAAGLDVLNGEPQIQNHPLVEYAQRHDNLIITPHCGGFSPDAVKPVCQRAAEKILFTLSGERI
jgi:D-3-phosphoglycerate dehydrogenase